MNRRELLGATLLGAAAACGVSTPSWAQSVVLDMPTWQADEPGFGDFYREAIAAFQLENPGISIRLQQIPYASYIDQMTIRFASGNPPAILPLPTDTFGQFAAQGWLEPLDERLASTDVPGAWTPLQKELVWDGKTQGVLMMGYGYMLFYNQAPLDAAGVAVPTSFDEFQAAVAKITNRDKGIFGLSAVTTEHPTVVEDFIRYIEWAGEDFVKDGRYNLRAPGVIKAMEAYRKTVGGNAPLGNNSTVARQLFTYGRTAFLIDGPWMYARVEGADPAVRPNLKMIPAPFRPVLGGASNSVHLPAGLDAAKREAAWKFIAFLTQKKWQERFLFLTASPSGNTKALSTETMAANPHLAAIAKGAEGAGPIIPNIRPIRANISEFRAVLRRGGLQIISSSQPVAKILDGIQTELERVAPLNGN